MSIWSDPGRVAARLRYAMSYFRLALLHVLTTVLSNDGLVVFVVMTDCHSAVKCGVSSSETSNGLFYWRQGRTDCETIFNF